MIHWLIKKNFWVYLERAHPAFLTTLVVLVQGERAIGKKWGRNRPTQTHFQSRFHRWTFLIFVRKIHCRETSIVWIVFKWPDSFFISRIFSHATDPNLVLICCIFNSCYQLGGHILVEVAKGIFSNGLEWMDLTL